jgi:hypothetical protein
MLDLDKCMLYRLLSMRSHSEKGEIRESFVNFLQKTLVSTRYTFTLVGLGLGFRECKFRKLECNVKNLHYTPISEIYTPLS